MFYARKEVRISNSMQLHIREASFVTSVAKKLIHLIIVVVIKNFSYLQLHKKNYTLDKLCLYHVELQNHLFKTDAFTGFSRLVILKAIFRSLGT